MEAAFADINRAAAPLLASYGDVVRVGGTFYSAVSADRVLERAVNRGDAALAADALRHGATADVGTALHGLLSDARGLADVLAAAGARVAPDALLRVTDAPPAAVARLIAAGADPRAADFIGPHAPLRHAIKRGRADLVPLLIPADIAPRDLDEHLIRAAGAGQTDIVELLLDRGADVHAAVLQCGDNADEADAPLLRAAQHGHAETVRLLLARGANVDPPGDRSRGGAKSGDAAAPTALGVAAREGHADVVRLLLAAGADVHAPDRDGPEAAMRYAVSYGHEQVVKLLIDAGADVNINIDTHCTPLATAAENGHTSIVKMLIEAGARVNDADEEGMTALCAAAAGGRTAAVLALLDAGAAIHAPDAEGPEAALGYAIVYNHIETVRALIARGADVNANGTGQMLAHAVVEDLPDIAQLLLDRGADLTLLRPKERARLAAMRLKIRRATADECWIGQEPLAPGAPYRRCVSNVPHTINAAYAAGEFAHKCPVCRLPYDPLNYINA